MSTTTDANGIHTTGVIHAQDLVDIANFYRQHFSVDYTPPSGKVLLSHWTDLKQAISNGAGTLWGVTFPNLNSGKIITTTWPYPIELAFYANLVIGSNVYNYDVATYARNAGWNGSIGLQATITVNSGCIVGSANTSSPAFTIANIPTANSKITLINNGYILGAGGSGGAAGPGAGGSGDTSNGYPGGTALSVSVPVTITNAGIIGGGGGGGGGGAGGSHDGSWNASGGPGSGGAGSIVGPEGFVNTSGTSNGRIGRGNPGSTLTGGPAGGAGNQYQENGGRGGDLGQAGGSSGWGWRSGGAGGDAVVGNSNITWANYGDVRGTVA